VKASAERIADLLIKRSEECKAADEGTSEDPKGKKKKKKKNRGRGRLNVDDFL
jgi:hypothetical protein